jgi:hypothetical protein
VGPQRFLVRSDGPWGRRTTSKKKKVCSGHTVTAVVDMYSLSETKQFITMTQRASTWTKASIGWSAWLRLFINFRFTLRVNCGVIGFLFNLRFAKKAVYQFIGSFKCLALLAPCETTMHCSLQYSFELPKTGTENFAGYVQIEWAPIISE